MARPVEDHHGDVADPAAQRLSQHPQVPLRGPPQIHLPGGLRGDDELFHVDVGRMEDPALLRHRHDRDGVGQTFGDDVWPIHRVDGHIDGEPVAAPHFLADVEHGGLIPRPRADNDAAVDRQFGDRRLHRPNRRRIRLLGIPFPHVPGRGNRRGLGHLDDIEREGSFHCPRHG